MQIFPAIDLMNGQCVRLRQGDFADSSVYESDPVAQAKRFEADGASWLHVVDLDGARDGNARQTALIEKIAQETSLAVQAGGGLRCAEDIETLLACDVRRVVVGSVAVQNPELVQGWIDRFGGERLVLALDIRLNEQGAPIVLTRGWQDQSERTLWDLLSLYEGKGAQTLLCTDVSRDGMLSGANVDLYCAIRARFPSFDLLASGGIGGLDDLRALATAGVAGAITGKALYENKFTLREAIREAADAC